MTNELITLLEEKRAVRLQQLAEHSGVPAHELLRRAVDELLQKSDGEIAQLASTIVRKNAELYQRLS